MRRAHRNQTGGLQGLYTVTYDDLADNKSGSRLRLATQQAKLDAACSDEMLSSNVMSAPLLGRPSETVSETIAMWIGIASCLSNSLR